MRRPISHVCAVFVFALFVMVTLKQVLGGVRDVLSITLAVLCLVQLLGMFVAPRDRRQYLLGVILLTLIAMNAMYDMAVWPGYQLYAHAPGARGTWGIIVVNAIAASVLFYLAYDYARGPQSIAFFQSGDKKQIKRKR